MFKTLTLASIYELQGFKEEALIIYQEVLKKDPSNFEASKAVKRLGKDSKVSHSVNKQAKDFFLQAQSKEDLRTFERWLMQWN